MLKQITSTERARRRREFVRQKCRRYGWEPFSTDEPQATAVVEQGSFDEDQDDEEEEEPGQADDITSETPASMYSMELI